MASFVVDVGGVDLAEVYRPLRRLATVECYPMAGGRVVLDIGTRRIENVLDLLQRNGVPAALVPDTVEEAPPDPCAVVHPEQPADQGERGQVEDPAPDPVEPFQEQPRLPTPAEIATAVFELIDQVVTARRCDLPASIEQPAALPHARRAVRDEKAAAARAAVPAKPRAKRPRPQPAEPPTSPTPPLTPAQTRKVAAATRKSAPPPAHTVEGPFGPVLDWRRPEQGYKVLEVVEELSAAELDALLSPHQGGT